MKNYPTKISVNGKIYPLNTDFRVALECNSIAMNKDISEYEKTLAVIYKLAGNDALDDSKNYDKILKLLQIYLFCGKSLEEVEKINALNKNDEQTMDFEQDSGYINASFMSDYGIDLNDTKMHWYKFMDYLNGLTDNSVINRVRSIRQEPLDDKKGKELEMWEKMKKSVELKVDYDEQEKTQEEIEADNLFDKQLKGE